MNSNQATVTIHNIVVPGRKIKAIFYPVENGTIGQKQQAEKFGAVALFDTPHMTDLRQGSGGIETWCIWRL